MGKYRSKNRFLVCYSESLLTFPLVREILAWMDSTSVTEKLGLMKTAILKTIPNVANQIILITI